MSHLLIITTLDVEGRRNNREHHAIRHLSPHYDRVTVVYRKRGGQKNSMRGLFLSTRQIHDVDGIRYVGVDPLLNPAEGSARKVSGTGSGRTDLRRVLGAVMDTVAILRDVFSMIGLARAARSALSQGKGPTTVEAFGPWAAMAGCRLRSAGLVRHVVYIDRDFEPGFMVSPLRRRWAGYVERRAARRSDLTLSIGRRLARRFEGLPDAHVALSPTGVDVDTFTAVTRSEASANLIFIGRVADWSGLDAALDAMSTLTDLSPKLTVLGPVDPPFQAVLDARIAQHGLGESVTFMGDQPRDVVAAALNRAAIGLACFHPTELRIHAAPLKLLEYMASGLPVIAVAGSEAGDMTSRHDVGMVCNTTAHDLAETIRAVCADASRYEHWSRNGPIHAASYDWARIMADEEVLLRRLDSASFRGMAQRSKLPPAGTQ